jgi:hypothetical protein
MAPGTKGPLPGELRNKIADARYSFARIYRSGRNDAECDALASVFTSKVSHYTAVIKRHELDVAALLRRWRDEHAAEEPPGGRH